MFTPRLVIRDKRPLTKKIAAHLDQIASERGTVNVPDYQVCTEYVSRRAKAVASALMLSMVSFVTIVAYQTVYPSYDSEPFVVQANLPHVNDPAPSYRPFTPYVNQVPHAKGALYTVNLSEKKRNEQFTCLAKNIYFEARSESLKGRLAVGLVTLNRVQHEDFPDTICNVVWQDRQFSWTHDGMTDSPNPGKLWERSKDAAEFLLSQGTVDHLHDFTDNAIFYHANYVSPSWNKAFRKTAEVGAHLFYRPHSPAENKL